MSVSLIHPDRCEHENRDSQPADRSVGFWGYICCEDCGADLSDDCRYNGEEDPWDDGDRAYDAWKDEREWDRD